MRAKSWCIGMAAALVVSLSAAPAWAQRETGAIAGKVVDQQGAALPGVTLTLVGTGMPGQLTFTTGADGDYRFAPVRPGTYTVTAELQGFANATQPNVIVSIGLTVDVDLRLQLAGVEESVTVMGQAPTVDTTSNLASVSFAAQLLSEVPLKRDIYDVFRSSPGVVADESGYRATVSAGGTGVRGTGYNFDGVGINDVSAAYVSVRYFNFNSFDEVEVITGSMPAEVTNSTGAFINIVTKSGGNQLSGGASAFLANTKTSYGVRKDVIAQGVLPGSIGVNRNLELPVYLGGPIARDKVWFFGSYAHLNNDINRVGFRYQIADITEHDEDLFGKITWQVTSKQKVMGSVKSLYTRQPHMDIDIAPNRSPEANYNETVTGPVVSFSWTDVLSQKTFLEVRGGINFRRFIFGFQPDSFASTFDTVLNEFTGSETGGTANDRHRTQATVALSHYASLAGKHDFKTGFDYVYATQYSCGTAFGGQQNTLANGVPTFVLFSLSAPDDFCTTSRAFDYGGFVQDNWTVGSRLTLNLGLRVDHATQNTPFQSYGPRGKYPDVLAAMAPALYGSAALTFPPTLLASWPSVSPRLGVTIDLPSARKTALKAGFGRYNEGIFANAFVFPTGGSTTHRWTDSNGNLVADIGEFGPPISTSIPARLYPPTNRPYWEEYSVGLNRELFGGFGAGVRFVYRENKNLFDVIDVGTQGKWIPVTIYDPGQDGVRGTADDIGAIQAYDLPVSALGTQRVAGENLPGATRRYKAVEITADKRLANNWQMYSSVVFSKSTGNFGQSYAGTQRAGVFLNPNTEINSYGLLDMDSPYQVKIGGSYRFPKPNIIVAANYLGISGFPWTRTFNTSTDINGQRLNVGNILLNAEPLGSHRLPNRNEVSLNVQKEFKLQSGSRLTLRLDGFNILNNMSPILVNGTTGPSSIGFSGPNFGRPATFLPPGYYRVGAEWKF